MKLFKHKNFMALIYSVFVALPFCAILGRVVYTACNKNAYASYSNTTKMYFKDVDNTNALEGNTLYFNYDSDIGGYEYSQGYMYSWSSVDFTQYLSISISYTPSGIQLYSNGIIRLYNPNDLQWRSYTTGDGIWGRLLYNFTIVLSENVSNPFTGGSTRIQVMYPTQDKLDNAFEYSLSTFIDDNNFGNLDFFSWFSNLFLDTTNTHNMLYINFLNWYMNYALFISLAYVLFLVLMWFVSFVRRLLENTQNMNIGGL